MAVTSIQALRGKRFSGKELYINDVQKPQLQLSKKHLNVHLLHGDKPDDKILQYVQVLTLEKPWQGVSPTSIGL